MCVFGGREKGAVEHAVSESRCEARGDGDDVAVAGGSLASSHGADRPLRGRRAPFAGWPVGIHLRGPGRRASTDRGGRRARDAGAESARAEVKRVIEAPSAAGRRIVTAIEVGAWQRIDTFEEIDAPDLASASRASARLGPAPGRDCVPARRQAQSQVMCSR